MWAGWRAAWARVGGAAVLAAAPGLAACIPDPLSLAAGDAAAADATPAADGASGEAESGADGASSGDGGSGSGCTCVAPAPPGWSFVAFESSSRTACPTGYDGPTDVLVDPTGLGPSSCDCACSATADPPSCTKGSLGLIGGNTSSCPFTGTPVPANGGACTSSPVGLPYPFLGVIPPTASGGSCTSSVTATPPPPGGTSGRSCAASASPPPGTCGSPQVCAPDAPSPYAICITQGGAVPCPAAYPHAHTTGTSITPGGCGTCTCGTPTATCTGGTFSAYFNGACGNLLLSVPADGACHSTSSGNASSYRFTVTPTNVTCPVAQAPQPTGNGALQGSVTVCCP